MGCLSTERRTVAIVNRKVTRIGNSLGVAMTEALKRIGLDYGDEVEIEVRDEAGEIVIRKAKLRVSLSVGFDPRFFEALQWTMERYRATLEGLKKR